LESFLVEVLWRGKIAYSIWQSDVRDEFLAVGGRVPVWATPSEAQAFAAANGIELVVNETKFDFDFVRRFVEGAAELDAEELLNAWNLLVDLGATIGAERLAEADRLLDEPYSRLFSLTRAGRIVGIEPEPLNVGEADQLRAFFRVGLEVLADVLESGRMPWAPGSK